MRRIAVVALALAVLLLGGCYSASVTVPVDDRGKVALVIRIAPVGFDRWDDDTRRLLAQQLAALVPGSWLEIKVDRDTLTLQATTYLDVKGLDWIEVTRVGRGLEVSLSLPAMTDVKAAKNVAVQVEIIAPPGWRIRNTNAQHRDTIDGRAHVKWRLTAEDFGKGVSIFAVMYPR